MRLLFKQRLLSWFDSYDIFDEAGNVVYAVKGELSWGHLLRIYNAAGNEVGYIKEVVLTILPRFEIYLNGSYTGCIKKELSFFVPKFNIDYKGWHVDGNWFEKDYIIKNHAGNNVAVVSQQLWKLTDTYMIDVFDSQDALSALMLVLAIDLEKCSRRN